MKPSSMTTPTVTAAAVLIVANTGTAIAQTLPKEPIFVLHHEMTLNAQWLCQQGNPAGCQQLNEIPQFSAVAQEIYRRCINGVQEACVMHQQNNQFAMQQFAKFRTQPSTGVTGGTTGQSPGDTFSSILDESHSGFMSRSGASSAGQTGVINGIQGNQIVIDPNGNSYTYNGLESKVWIDQSGQYGLGTNNPNYNPNLDPNVNSGGWFLSE